MGFPRHIGSRHNYGSGHFYSTNHKYGEPVENFSADDATQENSSFGVGGFGSGPYGGALTYAVESASTPSYNAESAFTPTYTS